jgi:hypothetical protein
VPLPRLNDERVLATTAELAGDGYCLVPELIAALPRRTHADRRRAIKRTVNRGLLIERRGPDGRARVALSAEGWRILRS